MACCWRSPILSCVIIKYNYLVYFPKSTPRRRRSLHHGGADIGRGGTKARRDDTAMVAVYTTPDIADKKPPAATPALQPAALIRLSRADNEHRRRASCLT
jgi:hypothetical protein